MSFLDEIHKQPRHHREIMFGLCVVTTLSLIGMVWYNSFQKDLYALLNPGQEAGQNVLAQGKNEPSMFGGFKQAGVDLKAAFLSVFNLTKDVSNDKKDGQAGGIEKTKTDDSGKVYLLPISGKK